MSNAYPLLSNVVENILLYYILIYAILSLFFKPDKQRVYCGIFAFCGTTNLSKDLYKLVLANIKLIGIQNDSRGGDNAGILLNNEIIHTEGIQSKFSELLQKNTLDAPDPEYSTVVIGHCRKGSVGGKSHKNAHPFEIYRNDQENDFYMAGVHNGTISNWKELAENYAIDPSYTDNDSKTILTILSRQRNLKRKQPVFRVLEQYKGFGVFIWYFVDEPNTMYIFKGATRTSEFNKTLYEERPLYYYECPITKGIYFSSLEEPLKMISADVSKVERLLCNVVFKVTNGKFVKKDEIAIDRESLDNFEPTYKKSSKTVNYGHSRQRTLYEDCCEDDDSRYAQMYGYGPIDHSKPTVLDKIFSTFSDSKKEEEKAGKEPVQSKTSMIDVTNVVKKDFPRYSTTKLDLSKKSLTSLAQEGLIYRQYGLYYLKGRLLTGNYLLNKITYKCYEFNDPAAQIELKEKPHNIETKYFFEGYMLKDHVVYDKLMKMKDTFGVTWKSDKTDDFMSHYCTMPVPGITNPNVYYLSGIKASYRMEGIPYAEGKIYHFKDGALDSVLIPMDSSKNEVEITSKKVVPLITNPEELKKAADELGIPYQRTKDEVKELNNSVVLYKKKEEKDDSKELEKPIFNSNVIPIEESYVIDSQEEEILELYKELYEKCQEQLDLLDPYIRKGTVESTDFLSTNFMLFFKDSIEACLLSPDGKNNSPYFQKDEDNELIYKGLQEHKIGEFNIF